MGETPHRDFDAEPLEPLPPSCTFTLGGRTWTCRNSDDVPFGQVQALFSAGSAGELAIQIGPFFTSVLIPEDGPAFLEMLAEPSSAMTQRKLQPIIEYLTEVVLGFPTSPPSSSSPARRQARPRKSSKARSSSPGTPRVASAG